MITEIFTEITKHFRKFYTYLGNNCKISVTGCDLLRSWISRSCGQIFVFMERLRCEFYGSGCNELWWERNWI